MRNRAVGTATVVGEYADVGHSRSVEYLRTKLAVRLFHYGLDDLDGATIRLNAPRGFTQEISRFVYECASPAGEPAHARIRHRSRLGDDIHNWAIFEPAQLGDAREGPLSVTDSDLRTVLTQLGLRLVEGG